MSLKLIQVSILVRNYDEAIEFYVTKLGFEVLEDKQLPGKNKRWVLIAPPGSNGTSILLAKAANEEQLSAVGNQAGGRVFMFLRTDNFKKDYLQFVERGVNFLEKPRHENYGTVAVFKDLYGNLWDLIETAERAR